MNNWKSLFLKLGGSNHELLVCYIFFTDGEHFQVQMISIRLWWIARTMFRGSSPAKFHDSLRWPPIWSWTLATWRGPKLIKGSWWTDSCKGQKDGRDNLLPKKQMMWPLNMNTCFFCSGEVWDKWQWWCFWGVFSDGGGSDVHADVVSQIFRELKRRLEAVHL